MQVLLDLLATAGAFLAEVGGVVALAIVLGRSWREPPAETTEDDDDPSGSHPRSPSGPPTS